MFAFFFVLYFIRYIEHSVEPYTEQKTGNVKKKKNVSCSHRLDISTEPMPWSLSRSTWLTLFKYIYLKYCKKWCTNKPLENQILMNNFMIV